MSTDDTPAATDAGRPRGFELDRPPAHVFDSDTVFKKNSADRIISNVVRLIIPPQQFENIKTDQINKAALIQIIEDVQTKSNVKQTRCLMHASPIGFVINIAAKASGIDRRSTEQSTFSSFRKQVNAVPRKALVEAAKEFTDYVGIETGTLDLSPLGMSRVPTSRLLLKEDRVPGYVEDIGYNPLEKLLTACQQGCEPVIYEFVCGGGKGGYQGSARFANYNPRYAVNGDLGFTKLIEEPNPIDPIHFYGPFNFTTNQNIDVSELWRTKYVRRIDGSTDYRASYNYVTKNQYRTAHHIRSEADRLRNLVVGKKENTGLMNGTPSNLTKEYKDLDLYGWFNFDPTQLNLFAQLVPLRLKYNPWKALEYRSAPVFHTDNIVRSVDAALQGPSTGTQYAPVSKPNTQNEGSSDHRGLEVIIEVWFGENGDTISKVKQTTESLPDLVLITDDGTIVALGLDVGYKKVNVEAENKNKTKPATTLTNAERARADGRHVLFVYKSKSKAKTGQSHLYQPYRGKTEFGTWLYNDTDTVTCSDGRTPAIKGPAATTTAEWEIDPLGRRQLSVAGEPYKVFGPDESPEEATYDYYYRQDGDSHRIEKENGELVEEYTLTKSLKRSWTRLSEPHWPTDYQYGHDATIMHQRSDTASDQLVRFAGAPDWKHEYDRTTGKVDKLSVVMEHFLDERVVECGGQRLPYDEFQEQFRNYCVQWLDIEPPHNSVIGRTLPKKLKEAKKGGTDNRNPFFEGFAFPFPLAGAQEIDAEE